MGTITIDVNGVSTEVPDNFASLSEDQQHSIVDAAANKQVEPTEEPKTLIDKAKDYVGPSFIHGVAGTALGAAAAPGIKMEVEKYGLPGLRPDVTKGPGSLQSYLDTQLHNPKGTVTVEGLSEKIGAPIRTQSEVQDALSAIKGAPGERKPITKMVNGVPTIVRYEDIPTKAPVDIAALARETEAAKPGVLQNLRTSPGSALKGGIEKTGEFLNRVISPQGLATKGTHLLGALGGLDVGLQGTRAAEHFSKGEIGRGLSNTLGAVGGAAALTRHPLVMPLGIGAAVGSHYLNDYLERMAKEHPDMHLAAGGSTNAAQPSEQDILSFLKSLGYLR